MKPLLAAVLLLAALLTTPRTPFEDMHGWNCRVQGNRICGETP